MAGSNEPSVITPDPDLPGMADLWAAVGMVASGRADSVDLCGFPHGRGLLNESRQLEIEGLAIEPLIRSGGGGLDIRVRRTRSVEV